ncbi:hypothetical protein MTBBW1_290010 [Desulfamplus magnetovallimortis]|uniref:Signal transduction histidine kinase dimerisation/phosphoacceptor domain-containing protein n=1 Tax=Desulfamplus magnetovallimortis TaxID=1246637 RepID=A0A1W1HFG2_9BACT|nr:hypothetical protein [Desulfamplus magnetovallimortis]SLM31229.1 hypothetical protein MTBBW1_290010 [Desulfamplus magnetovallimortis]
MNSQETLKPKFFGKITASVSHEMQNVLAIIKESAGLMEDLLMMAERQGGDITPERLFSCLATIKKQVTRGTEITSSLNSFAHTADHETETTDIIEITTRLLILTDRLARNAGMEMAIAPCHEALKLKTDPLQIQACLHLAMECLFTCLNPGTIVTFKFNGREGLLSEIEITASNKENPVDDIRDRLSSSSMFTNLTDALEKINTTASPLTSGLLLTFKK